MDDGSRPREAYVKFERNLDGTWDTESYGCPSCWFYCALDIEQLKDHISRVHHVRFTADDMEEEVCVAEGEEIELFQLLKDFHDQHIL